MNIKILSSLLVLLLLLTGCSQKAVNIDDEGIYYVNATLEGGSGKVTIESPVKLVVQEESRIAYVKWSSPNYDYMLVKGKKYLPLNSEGNSQFAIPIEELDVPFTVIGDTIAMSVPHEIEYTITLHSENAMLEKDTPMARAKYSVYVAVGIIVVCIVVSKAKKVRKKKRMAEMMKND